MDVGKQFEAIRPHRRRVVVEFRGRPLAFQPPRVVAVLHAAIHVPRQRNCLGEQEVGADPLFAEIDGMASNTWASAHASR